MYDKEKLFRNYDQLNVSSAVRKHYCKMRKNQTVEYVQRMHKKYLTFDKPMHLLEEKMKIGN